jgi:phosphomannomutase
LAEKKCSVSALRDSYPKYIISKNKIELTPAINVDQLLEKMISAYSTNEIDTTDGVKIYFDKEWVHLRKSNTEPIIRIYSESQNKEKAEELAQNIISQIKSLIA